MKEKSNSLPLNCYVAVPLKVTSKLIYDYTFTFLLIYFFRSDHTTKNPTIEPITDMKTGIPPYWKYS